MLGIAFLMLAMHDSTYDLAMSGATACGARDGLQATIKTEMGDAAQ